MKQLVLTPFLDQRDAADDREAVCRILDVAQRADLVVEAVGEKGEDYPENKAEDEAERAGRGLCGATSGPWAQWRR